MWSSHPVNITLIVHLILCGCSSIRSHSDICITWWSIFTQEILVPKNFHLRRSTMKGLRFDTNTSTDTTTQQDDNNQDDVHDVRAKSNLEYMASVLEQSPGNTIYIHTYIYQNNMLKMTMMMMMMMVMMMVMMMMMMMIMMMVMMMMMMMMICFKKGMIVCLFKSCNLTTNSAADKPEWAGS